MPQILVMAEEMDDQELLVARIHNKRREREYPTSMILPNALRKVMT